MNLVPGVRVLPLPGSQPWCGEGVCRATWKVGSTNQGRLDVVNQEKEE